MRTPTFPRPDTLTARALMRLLQGRKFTHREFQNETASYRLSGYIENLRSRHGWIITTTEETAPTNDPTGRMATYGRYAIDPEMMREFAGVLGARIDVFCDAVSSYEGGKAAR